MSHGTVSAAGARFDAVCFDLDGTLLRDDHIDGVVRAVADEIARRHPELDAKALAEANERAWWAYWPQVGDDWMRGILPTDAVPIEVWRRALAECGAADAATTAREAFELHTALEGREFRLYDESLEVLDELRARGIRIALITNGPSGLQRAKLAAVGVSDAFDTVIVSGEVRVHKPDPEIFAAALAPLGIAPDRALHIGDNLEADVGGALASGLTAVWINRTGRVPDETDPVPDAEVEDLRGLLTLLG